MIKPEFTNLFHVSVNNATGDTLLTFIHEWPDFAQIGNEIREAQAEREVVASVVLSHSNALQLLGVLTETLSKHAQLKEQED